MCPMNLCSMTAPGIGAMVGAGIFAQFGQKTLIAGRETYLSFMLGGVIAVRSGYARTKLAARYPDAGGGSCLSGAACRIAALACVLWACSAQNAPAQTPSPLQEWQYPGGISLYTLFMPDIPKWRTTLGLA